MPNKNINSPHDKVFKAFLTTPQTARDFLDIYLPERFKSQCDLSTLELQPESFLEEDFQAYYSDVLYSLKTRAGKGYVYALVEHQSSLDENMAFRLINYTIKVMKRHLDSREKKLPLVVPLLFYHGKVSPYPYSMNWFDCFQEPDLAKQLYNQPFPLVDITVIPDNEIMGHKRVALLELVQKHIRIRDIMELTKPLVTLLLNGYTTEKQVKSLITYLIQQGETESVTTLLDTLANQVPEHEGTIMTIAEQLRQEGHQKGHQKGRQEGERQGRQKVARKMLASGLNLEMICEMTGLTESELEDRHLFLDDKM